MSPALVDSGAHAATAAAAAAAPSPRNNQPKPSPPARNPKTGETPAGAAPSPTAFSADPLRVPTVPMDPAGAGRGAPAAGRPGERNLESVFSMLFPQPKAETAPPPPPGLSKPRFAKVRRHWASPRVRPGSVVAADPDDGGDPGFNPFRWVPPSAGDASGRVAAEMADHSSSGHPERAKSEGASFLFGRNIDLGGGDSAATSAKNGGFIFTSGGSGNSGGLHPAKPENASFEFAAGHSTGNSTTSHFKSSVREDAGNASHNFAAVGSQGSAPTASGGRVFGFGTRANSSCFDGNMASRVPVEIGQDADLLGKMKESDYISEVDQKNACAFGVGHNFGSAGVSSIGKLPEEEKVTDAGRGARPQSGNSKQEGVSSSAGGFQFGGHSKTSIVSDQSVADGFDRSATGKLPGEMQRLNIRGSGNADNIGKVKAGHENLAAGDGGPFAFGLNKNVPGSFSKNNFTRGAFVFGSSSKKYNVPDRSSTDGSEKSSVGKLPEEIQKLNIKDESLNHWSTNAENVNHKSTTDGGSSFGVETFPGAHMFHFGSTEKHTHFDENMTSRLPDEMKKLNLEVPSGLNALEKMKGPSPSSEVDQKGTFVFGSNQNIGSSHENYVNELPEELKTVNTGRGTTHQPENGKEEGMASSAGVFVFGNNSKRSTVPDLNTVEGFDKSGAGKLPDEMRKLKNRGFGNADNVRKASAGNDNVEANVGFVFGSGNVSESFGEGISTEGVFVFGVGLKKTIDPSRSAFDSSDKSSVTDNTRTAASGSNLNIFGSLGESNFSTGNFDFGSSSTQGTSSYKGAFNGFDRMTVNQLPDEMQKLNIRFPGDSSGSEKTKGGDHMVDGRFFVFGGRKDPSASSGESNSMSGAFVFGSSLDKSTVYNQSMTDLFDRGNKLPDEMQKLNIRASMDNDNLEKIKDGDHKSMANDCTDAYDSGINEDISASCSNDYSTRSASAPLQFSFPTINQDGSSSVSGVPPAPADYYVGPSSDTNTSSCSSSFGPVPCSSGYDDSTFTGYCEGPGTPQNSFRTKQDAARCSRDSFVSASCQNVAFNVKKGVVNHLRSKKRRGKLRDSATHARRGGKGFISKGKSSQVNSELDSPEDYSPMDFSPCQLDTSVAEERSREASVASGESTHFTSHHSSIDTQNSVSVGPGAEDLVQATECLYINEEIPEHQPPVVDMNPPAETGITVGLFGEEHVSGFGFKVYPSKMDAQNKTGFNKARVNTATDFSGSTFQNEAGDSGSEFTFASCSKGISESRFTFASMPSTQGSCSASKPSHRRKFKAKGGREHCFSNADAKVHSSSGTAQLFPDVRITSQLDSARAQTGFPSVSQRLEGKKLEINKKPEVTQESISVAAASIAAQEACEKWRLRGNQAYANGDLSKAEEYYTRGVNSTSPDETSRSYTRALMLCYSNRAATRMSIGRVREALHDCLMAAAIDPDFLRAQLRAANCHLLLGEIEDARSYFKKCLPTSSELCVDHKFVSEASDGLQKAKEVADYMERAAALLKKRTINDASAAVQIISDALSLSPYSESLIELKAEALLTLRHYDELIQLCDQTLDSAERNSRLFSEQFKLGDNSSRLEISHARTWRCYLKARAYFCLGRLEEALTLLQEHEKVEDIIARSSSKLDSLTLLSSTVSELLRLKIAGNTAFKAGQHSEAVEHYTTALAYNIESRPFAAVCFCNRAAAYQALGQITDAIADCSLAIALDPKYPKAISRRATLHEMIRDYSQATNDLRRLLSLLERKSEDKSGGKRPTNNGDDPEFLRIRLAKVEEKGRKEIPLDVYTILGIESSSDAAEIKKAYRKAALRHHPDKAGQFLVRSENTDEGLWKEVADEVHRDADRLFKVIGEAYAVLSDPSKRLQYDTEEEIRSSQKSNSGASTPRSQPDFHSSHFERSSNRWQSRDPWRSYGSSNQRWSGSYRGNRYF